MLGSNYPIVCLCTVDGPWESDRRRVTQADRFNQLKKPRPVCAFCGAWIQDLKCPNCGAPAGTKP